MATFADFYNAGNVPEDVINALFDISPIERPYTGRIAHIGADSAIKEWLDHVLRAPKNDNAVIDGADQASDETSQGTRYRNPLQLQEAGIQLGDQAMESDGFGNITKFETQLEKRVNELYRDLEARSLSAKASVLPVAGTTAGEQGGFFAQVKTATAHGAGGSAGGWNAGTGVFDAPTLGTPAAMSETTLLGIMETISTNGGRPDAMTMRPPLKRRFSSFMMTSSSRVGVLVTQAPGGAGGATAVGTVMVYETDFGTLEVLNNQIMLTLDAPGTSANDGVAIFQTDMANCADQWTPRAKRLGPGGHGERWSVSNSSCAMLLTEKAHGGYFDIDATTDMVA